MSVTRASLLFTLPQPSQSWEKSHAIGQKRALIAGPPGFMGARQLGFKDYGQSTAKSRSKRDKFLAEVAAVILLQALIALIKHLKPKTSSKGGKPLYPLATILRNYLL